MRWSWNLGRIAGIDVKIHTTFLLLLVWVAFSFIMLGYDLPATLGGLLFIILLFACVILHELGHALAARRFDIKTRDITLLPIGGVARLERMPDDPGQELIVALAGPAVSLSISAVLFIWLLLTAGLAPPEGLSLTGGSIAFRLMVLNVFLAAFNLLPAFPMDGGRVLRAILASRMEYVRATQIAATIGQGAALLFGFAGLFLNPLLIFIALFVWIGAAQEASMVQMRSALGGIPVSRAMVSSFQALSPYDTLSRAVELLLSGTQQDFPVVQNGTVVGVLLRSDLLVALARGLQEIPVAEVMRRDFQMVEATEMLETAFQRLQVCDCHALPVVDRGQLVGLVTKDNVGEFIMVQSALGSAARR